jgi:hypothetical protein
VGEPYSVRLGREPEQAAISIERIAPTRLDEFEAGLFPAVKQTFADLAIHSICDVQRVGAEARDLHDLGYAARIEALEPRARLNLIEGAQLSCPQPKKNAFLRGRPRYYRL